MNRVRFRLRRAEPSRSSRASRLRRFPRALSERTQPKRDSELTAGLGLSEVHALVAGITHWLIKTYYRIVCQSRILGVSNRPRRRRRPRNRLVTEDGNEPRGWTKEASVGSFAYTTGETAEDEDDDSKMSLIPTPRPQVQIFLRLKRNGHAS